ncbi:ankyrin repeat-containing domain protein, partial [Mycena vulgaris]
MSEVLGIVTGSIQLVDTALKARDYCKDFYNAPAEQRKLFTELDYLTPLLAELQKRVAASPSSSVLQNMVQPLDGFKTMMEKFTAKFELSDGQWSKLAKRFSWTLWNKKEAKEYLAEFESVKSLLNTWLAVRNWDAGEKHDQDNKKEHHAILAVITRQGRTQEERNQEAEKKEILDWITPLNFFQRQDDIFSTWQEGTGEWLLADLQFKNWESGSDKILWCRGIPGAGKTVLSSLVVNHLRAQFRNTDIGVACIYLNHKETDVQTPVNLLASLWKQLVVDTILPPAVHDLYKHHRTRDTRPSLAEVSEILKFTVAQHSRVYLVVDALDEYFENPRNILLKALTQLPMATTSLMFTSRLHITLDGFFPDLSSLEIHASDNDIRHYVEQQIQISSRLSRHVQKRPELRNEITSKIASNVQGMFLLAKLHTESLATKSTIRAVRDALQHLPTDLNHTYDEAMNRIHSQNKDDKELALQALTWVAYAKRPLSVGELQEAMAIEPDVTTLDADNLLDINIVLSVCAGLLIVDEAMSVVRLIHYTTQGFFDNIRPVQFANADTWITSQCLTYLSFDEFSNINEFLNINEFSNIPWHVKHERILKWLQEHPLVAYSQHFLLHAAAAPQQLTLLAHLEHFVPSATLWRRLWSYDLQGEPVHPWNYPDWPSSPSILWILAASNLIHITSDFLDQRTDLCRDSSLLPVTVFYGHLAMAELLVNFGADVRAEDKTATWFRTALQAASQEGHEPVVRFLIEKGADVNGEGGNYGTALQAASAGGHEPVVRFLIEKGADMTAEGGYYGTALQAASTEGHEPVVQFLIEKGADVNAEGGSNRTALQAASAGGHEPVVRFLIEMGADVTAEGGYHGTALQAASTGGHEPVVRFLIEKGADVNAEGGRGGTALQAASTGGHEPVVRFLIEKGADVNAEGGRGGTALQAASAGGHEPVVRFLIEKGADVTAEGGFHGTALQAASLHGHEPVVRFLIEKGADVNAEGGRGGTALQAASAGGHEPVVRFLIEKGADVTAEGGFHGTALQAASLDGHEPVVRFLIEKGADVTAGGGYFGTALQAATSQGHEPMVRFLIEKGADVNAEGGIYGTALQAASAGGHEPVVRFLIEKGADVNAEGGFWGTALQAASAEGHESVVQFLIEKGADVNSQGGHYGTALQAASARGHEPVVRFLIEKGADVNSQGGLYGTALQAAAYRGCVPVAQVLIQKGANVNQLARDTNPLW